MVQELAYRLNKQTVNITSIIIQTTKQTILIKIYLFNMKMDGNSKIVYKTNFKNIKRFKLKQLL